jgi:hypothetical protein
MKPVNIAVSGLNLLFICILFFSFQLKATNAISGRVVDTKKQPIEFATVSLLNSKTKVFVKGEVSNQKGEFIIDNIKPGNYTLYYSHYLI